MGRSPFQHPDNVRTTDPETSADSADLARHFRRALKTKVLFEFRIRGAMTAGEAEQLPAFSDYGPSSVRKRISELAKAGQLESVGRRGRMTIYDIPPMSGEQREMLI